MSEKVKRIAELQSSIPVRWTPPPVELVNELTLLEAGLLCILTRQLSESAADKTLKSLRATYPDWNELRVSQVQEYQGLIKSKSDELSRSVAFEVKNYLQEVFQKNHGFDLEFLREDPNEAGKFVLQLFELGASAGHYLLWIASGGEAPSSTGMIRVLDRLGVLPRTSSVRKSQQSIGAVVPAEDRAAFGVAFGQVIELWCDAKKPICWECVLVDDCKYGKKVFKDWKIQQKRLEQQRQREEERRKKEEERERKRALAEAKKREKEEEKRLRAEERKQKREARERELKKKALAKEAARKKAEAAAKKKTAKKKTAKKKTAKKKTAKKKTAKKKTAKKKTTRKPAKRVTKKPAKKVTRKPARKPTKKKVTKKPQRKKTTKRPTRKRKTGRR